MNGKGLSIHCNYNFRSCAEIHELSNQTVANTRPEFLTEDGRMRIAENGANPKRNNISVFNTVEKLNKHRSVFINYLLALASATGISFTIQQPPQQQPEEGATPNKEDAGQLKVLQHVGGEGHDQR